MRENRESIMKEETEVCVCAMTESLAIIATGSRWKYSKPLLIQFIFLILSGNNRLEVKHP